MATAPAATLKQAALAAVELIYHRRRLMVPFSTNCETCKHGRMNSWQVFSGGQSVRFSIDLDGLRVGEAVLPWSGVESIRYPTGYNVLLRLAPDLAKALELPEDRWALGFRSGAEQRAFRAEVDGLLRSLGNTSLPSSPAPLPKALARLDALTLVGGYEFGGLTPGGVHSLAFLNEAVVISAASGTRVEVAYDGLLVLGTEGPGAVTTGGGFIGGGFGLQGAAEGILAASVLNALTTKTTIEAYIELQDANSYWIFMSQHQTPEQLERLLKPVRARLRVTHERPALQPVRDSPSSDLVDQLERLAALRAAGALSEEQFETAKAKLLG